MEGNEGKVESDGKRVELMEVEVGELRRCRGGENRIWESK